MYTYHFFQWILFFFIYCFFGWIWESCYVSAKEHKWVNRGFLHGPLIPIYGSGAITVLFVAIPVRDNLALVFIFGMAGATLLEYVTGAAMEKLFKVRYWDYTGKACNLNGHICLGASLAWGAFSVLLIRYVHGPVERLVLGMQADIAEILSFVLVVAFAVDATQSFNEAMDLREVIERLTENSEELRRIQKRVDVIAAVIDADIQEYKRSLGERRLVMESLMKDKKYLRSVRLLRRNPGAVSRHYKEALEEVMRHDNIISRIKHKRDTE